MKPDSTEQKCDRFHTTQWSVILRAGDADSEGRRHAWNCLIETYWYPLYAYCRRRGASDQDAQDLVQGFFSNLLDGHGLQTVHPDKGRFRSFLLASLNNHVSNEQRNLETLRRGGGHTRVSLHQAEMDVRYLQESTREESPERAFERNWAEALLIRVKSRLAHDYELANKSPIYQLIEPYLMNRSDALPRGEIGSILNLSPAAVGMSIHRMRRRFGELLTEEVAATVNDPKDVDEELRHLITIVGS